MNGDTPFRAGAVATHYVSLAASFPVLLYVTRGQWFFFDEWNFLVKRGFDGNALQLFVPHGEHWSTIPILVYRLLFNVFALRTYLPYMVVLLLLHVAAAHLIWRLMRGSGVDAWLATALAIMFLFLGAGYENLIWAFQIGFVGSLVLGLAALLSVVQPRPLAGWRYPAEWTLAVAGLMCSGVGVTMVAMLGVTALLRRGLRAALLTISVPTAVYLLWFAVVGRQGLTGAPLGGGDLLLLPAYVWHGLTNTFDAISGLAGFGVVAILGVAVWIAVRRDTIAGAAPTAAAIAAVVFFIIDGLGRLQAGVDESSAPRYVYVATALLLPITGMILSSVARRGRAPQLAVLALIAIGLGHGALVLRDQTRAWGLIKQTSRSQIIAAAQLIQAGAPIIGIQPDPQWAPDMGVQELTVLAALGDLPPPAGLNAVDTLNARSALQITYSDAPRYPAEGPAVATVVSNQATAQSQSAGCITVTAHSAAPLRVRLDFAQPGSVRIRLPGGATVQLRFAMRGQTAVSDPRSSVLSSGVAFLNVAQAGASPYLDIPSPSAELCDVTSAQ